jgi:large conductance mechanosensitive channel
MKKFMEEFKAFAMRGNVIDLAVGMIIGSAFGKITTSLVNDVIMPAVSMLMGGVDFTQWKIVLKEAVMEMNAEGVMVEKAAEIAIKYGNLIAVIVDFIILAFAIFCMVKAINTMREKAEALKKKEEEAVVEEETPAEPEPSAEEKLLMEIRDILKNK